MMFERRVEPFGFGVSFKATTNPYTDPTQTSKFPDPMNPKSRIIADTSKKGDSKQKTPLDMATGSITSVKFGMGTFKDRGQIISSHTFELEIKGLA